MSEKERVTGFTKAEKEVLDAYIRYRSLTKAAKSLGIDVRLASARKQRALHKYRKAKQIVEDFEWFRRQAPSILEL